MTRIKSLLFIGLTLELIVFPVVSFARSQSVVLSSSPLGVYPQGPNFLINNDTGAGDVVAGKPSIAFDQVNFIIGWSQDYTQDYPQHKNIYAARITLAGEVLDPAGIPVSTQVNQEVGPPSVIFDGVRYLMVWAAKRNDSYELYAARILPNGTVLDPNGVALTSGGDPLQHRRIGLAFDGTNSMVVWRTSGSNLRGARISSSSGIQNLDSPTGFPIASLGVHYYPSIASDGSIFLVTWYDARINSPDSMDIYGARVEKNGTVIDPNGFVICDEPGNQDMNTVAFNGQSFWVVWYDERPNFDSFHGTVYGTRVSPEGTVLDSPAIMIADKARGQMPPQINCQGVECLVVWNLEYNGLGANFRLTDVYARRLIQDGHILDAQAIPVSTTIGHQFGPVIGYGAGRYLVAWNDGSWIRNYDGSLWGQILVDQTQPVSASFSTPLHIRASTSTGKQSLTWIQETVPIDDYASDGIAFDAFNSIAFGNNQRLVFQNDSWQSVIEPGYIWASWADRPDDIWIGGNCALIQHFDGTTWEFPGCVVFSDSHQDVTGLWGMSSGRIWAIGQLGHFSKHEFGEPTRTWQETITGSPYDLEDIWGSSESDVYAVGERGTIYHYNGISWSIISNVPTIQTLNAIWGSGPNDIFVVGDWGVILHYDGLYWSQQENSSTEHLFDVWGFNGKDVYAVGFSGTILHSDGTKWMPETSGSTEDLLSVWGVLDFSVGNKIVWASGSGQTILRHNEDVVVSHFYLPIVTNE